MRTLLDTCTFLWILVDDPALSKRARELFDDPGNEVFFSAVSAWEIALKYAHGRLALPAPPASYVPSQRERHGIEMLPLEEESGLYLPRLPKLHNDPFDRMLICQAIVNGFALLTPDNLISQYPVRTVW